MGQLQAKPAKLRAVPLLLIFSEGNACPCKSCHFRFFGISLGGVRKKRECSQLTDPLKFLTLSKSSCLFLCCNLSRLIFIHYSQAVCKQCTFQSHCHLHSYLQQFLFLQCLFIYKLALQSMFKVNLCFSSKKNGQYIGKNL